MAAPPLEASDRALVPLAAAALVSAASSAPSAISPLTANRLPTRDTPTIRMLFSNRTGRPPNESVVAALNREVCRRSVVGQAGGARSTQRERLIAQAVVGDTARDLVPLAGREHEAERVRRAQRAPRVPEQLQALARTEAVRATVHPVLAEHRVVGDRATWRTGLIAVDH